MKKVLLSLLCLVAVTSMVACSKDKKGKETDGIGTNAIDQLPAKIVEANSTEVDVITSATITSQGIIDAVNNALDPEKFPAQ